MMVMGAGVDGGQSEYKQKRNAQVKAKAGDSGNWNSLFMRSEAVGNAMAQRYGVDKSDFLDVLSHQRPAFTHV